MQQSQAIPKDRWGFAAAGLTASAPMIADTIKKRNFQGQGEDAAEAYLADIELAIIAMNYVANFAVDKVRFVPMDDASFEAAFEKLRELGGIR